MTPAETPPRPPLVGAEIDRLRSLTCAKWNWHDADVIPAWVADMDLPPVPAAVDAVRALVERGDFGYNMAAEFKLPEAFAEWQPSDIEGQSQVIRMGASSRCSDEGAALH